ncbi:hypothetical protein GCM10010468_72590 [Actinocorallia longicatena]|uniref:Uncharacterized protein n=2 Tax=Actinocorallia longicatena TaxID=111803 RepID=A0ABP6QKZ3_9ACTN
MEYSAQQTLAELTDEFAGWRIGRGGSGHWWAVRENDLIRTPHVEELRATLTSLAESLTHGRTGELADMVG